MKHTPDTLARYFSDWRHGKFDARTARALFDAFLVIDHIASPAFIPVLGLAFVDYVNLQLHALRSRFSFRSSYENQDRDVKQLAIIAAYDKYRNGEGLTIPELTTLHAAARDLYQACLPFRQALGSPVMGYLHTLENELEEILKRRQAKAALTEESK